MKESMGTSIVLESKMGEKEMKRRRQGERERERLTSSDTVFLSKMPGV